jgi:hypothetical protein
MHDAERPTMLADLAVILAPAAVTVIAALVVEGDEPASNPPPFWVAACGRVCVVPAHLLADLQAGRRG